MAEEYEESEERETEDSEEIVEPVLTIGQAIGLVVLFFILSLWLEAASERFAKDFLANYIWLDIIIKNGLAGFITVQAGAILAGMRLQEMFPVRNTNPLGWISVILLGAGLGLLGMQFVAYLKSYIEVPKEYIELLGKFYASPILAALLAVSVVAPFAEESLFRGVMQEGLAKRYGKATVVFLCAFLFAVVHLIPWLVLNAFLLGLLLAWVKDRTKVLLYCVAIHGAYNAVPFVLNGIATNRIPFPITLPSLPSTQFLLVSILLIAAGITGLLSTPTPEQEPVLVEI